MGRVRGLVGLAVLALRVAAPYTVWPAGDKKVSKSISVSAQSNP